MVSDESWEDFADTASPEQDSETISENSNADSDEGEPVPANSENQEDAETIGEIENGSENSNTEAQVPDNETEIDSPEELLYMETTLPVNKPFVPGPQNRLSWL